MQFSQMIFVAGFLPLFLLLYFGKKELAWKNAVFFLASCFFLLFQGLLAVGFLCFFTLFVFFMGKALGKATEEKKKKIFFLSIAGILLPLAFFKYSAALPFLPKMVKGWMPFGISFYSFRFIAYLYDCYQGKEAEQEIFSFSLFAFAFPVLSQGPILRYSEMREEIKNRAFSYEAFSHGLFRFTFGLWKKLANALHLRYAMRMVNVAPDLAKEEASKALHNSGGLIASDKEEALVRYVYDSFDWTNDEYRRNGLSQLMRGREDHPTMYICSTFFNYLGKTNDPRQFVYCRNYDQSSPNKPFGRADITDEMINTPKAKFQPVDPGYFHYEKWPSGYWSKQVKKYLMKECRPQINNIFLKLTSPGVIMTAAETKLLEAEAVARWGSEMSSETVEKLYAQGVKAAFHFLENYGADAFKDRDIDRYIRHNNVSNDLDDQLEKINTQLWILHFNNPWEGYANWRRSGYPVLKPSPDYGAKCIDSQTTPLRLCYPIFESSYNRVHYNEAIGRMGGTDDWNKPVWWDQ